MSLWKEFADRVRTGEPLAERTWFRLGGKARYSFSPGNVEELRRIVALAASAHVPVRVLGGGANLLVRDDGFDGLVVQLDEPGFTYTHYDGQRVRVGAGTDLMKLARDCCGRGLAGLQGLAGIPGTVGGAVTMNAGGRYGCIGDAVESVTLMDGSGEIHEASSEEMRFGYRRSAVGDRIVTGAVLRLRSAPAGRIRSAFHEAWKLKKASQPLAEHSAGCIFRNPDGDSAGRLIDETGLKGAACGRARVSSVHGNFIVADRGATSGDVLGLVRQVQEAVLARTGIRLELEIDVW